MSDAVRARFAPRPTGQPHIGNVRTALFNWLFARSQDGAFVLRVEDADMARQETGALEALLNELRWLGLDWDEGPDVGGQHAPYIQSQRLPFYWRHAQRLLDEDHAYRCYCSLQDLAEMQRDQEAQGRPPGYDGRCRELSEVDRAIHESHGLRAALRFKAPRTGQIAFHDMVCGEVTFDNATLDDFIILRSDGYPTYHLASVVDDHLMGITHVIRGKEWMPSTARHVLLYRALGWEPPQFAHLPLIVRPDRGKLSKREGGAVLEEYRVRGYLPEAIVNYLALLGWAPGTEEQLFSLAKLGEEFTLARVSKNSAVFDQQRLDWFGKQYVRRRPVPELARLVTPYLETAYSTATRHEGTIFSAEEWLATLVEHTREEWACLSDAVAHARFAFVDEAEREPEAEEALRHTAAGEVLQAFVADLPDPGEFDYNTMESYFKDLRHRFKESHGLSGRQVMFPVRAALTGTMHGPCLAAVVALLGKERCRHRLQHIPGILT